ncbi:hypothetical protein CEXT_658871 [Caerostris extrusa]|uniref:RNase H type-1 domain-containing protein n=1 Tax=Caerostris extrusa TaxID=172846 RepID=A0AAV4NJR0_CAEEX|nr:hypothetical protein CEXT_658871 [Caerostris extrusa]
MILNKPVTTRLTTMQEKTDQEMRYGGRRSSKSREARLEHFEDCTKKKNMTTSDWNLIRLYLLKTKHQVLSTGDVSVNAHDLEKISKILPPWESFKIKWSYFQQENAIYSIYTDGSKMENSTGSSFVVFRTGLRSTMSTQDSTMRQTVFHAELHAIELAINYIVKNNLEEDIITDSRSTLLALANPRNYEPNILSLKDAIKNFQHILTSNGPKHI